MRTVITIMMCLVETIKGCSNNRQIQMEWSGHDATRVQARLTCILMSKVTMRRRNLSEKVQVLTHAS